MKQRGAKIQGANTRTFIVPCEFAANIVGLSLFQHTALMKCELSSSLSSGFWDPNLCQDAGFDIACTLQKEILESWHQNESIKPTHN